MSDEKFREVNMTQDQLNLILELMEIQLRVEVGLLFKRQPPCPPDTEDLDAYYADRCCKVFQGFNKISSGLNPGGNRIPRVINEVIVDFIRTILGNASAWDLSDDPEFQKNYEATAPGLLEALDLAVPYHPDVPKFRFPTKGGTA